MIVALGKGVERKDLVVGSRVGMGFTCWTCGSCETCLDGHEAFCPLALVSFISFLLSSSAVLVGGIDEAKLADRNPLSFARFLSSL